MPDGKENETKMETRRKDEEKEEDEFVMGCRRRVIAFVHRWVHTIRDPVFDEPSVHALIKVGCKRMRLCI